MPTKLNEPRTMKTTAVAGSALQRSSGTWKNTASTMKMAAVWTRPVTIAYATWPISREVRRIGAIIVYSSVPSQRSTAIVSVIQLNTTDR